MTAAKHERRRKKHKDYKRLLEFLSRNDGQSLQQLEGEDWGDPYTAPTNLVRRCLVARRQAIRDMPLDDLRCLIGQGIGLKYLMPRALDIIEMDPLVDTDIGYPGSLLCAVLRTKEDFWREWPDMQDRVVALLGTLKNAPDIVDEAARQFRALTARDR